jgi:hypothetical protein
MELVDGEDLSQRIARGAIPIDEALPIAKQIANALEAAHEEGIIHRDLTPANIKLRPDGTVKVLDFGLAKAPGSDPAADLSHSPTLSFAATQAGMILGTAGYMSPEQARGKSVDKRADIWAFGVVLYEMLTGARLFTGEDAGETLAAVIKDEPTLDAVPGPARHLLGLCPQKDPRKRLRDIADARLLLETAAGASDAVVAGVPPRRLKMAWGVAAFAGVVALTAAPFSIAHFRESAPVAAPVRFQIAMPDKVTLGGGAFSVSPDGRKLVFAAVAADGTRRLYVRALDSLDARPLQGTEGAGPFPPFWSPDSRFVGFSIDNKYMKIDVTGGPPQTLVRTSRDAWLERLGAEWRDSRQLESRRNHAGSRGRRHSLSCDGRRPVAAGDLSRPAGLPARWAALPLRSLFKQSRIWRGLRRVARCETRGSRPSTPAPREVRRHLCPLRRSGDWVRAVRA